MRRTRGLSATGLLSVALLAGCASAGWRDRCHDFAQVFDASVSVGPGMAANIRITEVAQMGAGSFEGETAGLLDGRLTTAREQRGELGVSLLHTYEYRRKSRDLLDVRHPRYADPGYDPYSLSWQMESDRDLADVGLSLHVAWVGFGLTLKLGELWDALAGCVGADPFQDDAWSRPLEELRAQTQSLDAATRTRAVDALLRRGEPTHGYAIWTAREVTPAAQRRAIEAIRAESPVAPGSAPEGTAPDESVPEGA